jgi:DNA-binding GntR family transcriptional regulator
MSPKHVIDQLAEDIRFGRLPPGMVLRQAELATRFGLSRQPIRLALQSLRESGLLRVRPDRSLEVADLSTEQLRDLVAVRLLIEREALRLALPKRQARDVLEATQIQQRQELESDPRIIEQLDLAFHTALYRPCGNARLLKLVEGLRSEDRRPYHEQPIGSKSRERWARQHRRILKMYNAGDSAGADAALTEHLSTLEER